MGDDGNGKATKHLGFAQAVKVAASRHGKLLPSSSSTDMVEAFSHNDSQPGSMRILQNGSAVMSGKDSFFRMIKQLKSQTNSQMPGNSTTPPLNIQRSSLATYFQCPNPHAGQGVTFSPNYLYVLRWSFGPDLKVLDSKDATLVCTLTCGNGNVKYASWSSDSRLLVASTDDCKLFVWDVRQHMRRAEIDTGGATVVHCVLSEDGELVLTADDEGMTRLWSVRNSKHIRDYDPGHNVSLVGFAEEGRRLVLASSEEAGVTLLDLDDEHNITVKNYDMLEELAECRDKVHYTCSTDGAWLLAYMVDTTPTTNVVLVSTASLEHSELMVAEGNVTHCSFSNDGDTFVVCGRDNHVYVYLTEKCELLQTLVGHTSDILYCKILYDAKYALSGDSDGNLLFWDVDSGHSCLRLKGHGLPISFCDLTEDRKRALSVDVEGNTFLWNLDAQASAMVLRNQSDMLCCMEYSTDGNKMVVGYKDGVVKVWDLDRRNVVWQHNRHNGPVHAIAISPDGHRVASGGRDGVIIVADLINGFNLSEIREHGEAIIGLKYSFNGHLLVAAGRDSRVTIFKSNELKALFQLNTRDRDVPTNMALSPSGDTVAVTTVGGRLACWSTSTGAELLNAGASEVAATALTFNESGNIIAIGTADGSSHIYDLASGIKTSVLVGNASPVNSLYFAGSADNLHLVTLCARQCITWDLANSKKTSIADFICDSDSKFINTTIANRIFIAHDSLSLYDPNLYVAVYDTEEREKPHDTSYLFRQSSCYIRYHGQPLILYAAPSVTVHMLAPESAGFKALDFSSDGALLVTGSLRGELQVWDVAHRQSLYAWPAHKRCSITCVKFTHDASAVYSCGEDCKVILWDWRTRTSVGSLDIHRAPVVAVEMSLDGSVMASGDKDGVVIVWDARAKLPIQILDLHEGPVLCCSISPDGSKVASSGLDEHVFIVDAKTGDTIMSLDDALDGKGLTIKFSFDGTRVQVGSDKGVILVWDVNLNCLLYDIAAHEGKVYDASWSGDSRRLLSVGSDGHAHLWDAAAGSLICEANFERGFGIVESGGFIKCDLSVDGATMAGVTVKGTFMLWDVAGELRKTPDGDMMYVWLASMPLTMARETCARLLDANPLMYNLQDSRGWTILMHSSHNSNPEVTRLILQQAKHSSGMLGLTSSPVANAPGLSSGNNSEAKVADVSASIVSSKEVGDMTSSRTYVPGSEDEFANTKEPNALRIALEASSADCVQYLLDAVLEEKITPGSYRAVTKALPEIALQYPGMCQVFLSGLSLRVLGELEIPADIAAKGTQVVVHNSYTSYKELWEGQLRLNEMPKGPMVVMEAAMVRLPFVGSVGKGTLLHTLVEGSVPVKTFGSETVKSIINYKWNAFGKLNIFTRAAIYFIFTITFTLFAVLYSTDNPSNTLDDILQDGDGIATFSVSIVLFVFGVYYLFMEGIQLWELGYRAYFESFWNLVDIAAYVATLIIMPSYWTRTNISNGQFVPVLVALETILLWIKMLFFSLAVDGLGTFIFMTTEIMKGMRFFVVLLLVFFLSFGVAFMVLFRQSTLLQNGADYDPERYNPEHGDFANFGQAMLNAYVVIFSNTDPRQPMGTEWGTIATVLFCIYSFLLVTIMVNLLVTLMSDIYSRVKLLQDFVFLQGRAELIIEVESTSQLTNKVPPYLHILRPTKRMAVSANKKDESNKPDVSSFVGEVMSQMEARQRLEAGEGDGDKPPLERAMTGFDPPRQVTVTTLDTKMVALAQSIESLLLHVRYNGGNRPITPSGMPTLGMLAAVDGMLQAANVGGRPSIGAPRTIKSAARSRASSAHNSRVHNIPSTQVHNISSTRLPAAVDMGGSLELPASPVRDLKATSPHDDSQRSPRIHAHFNEG